MFMGTSFEHMADNLEKKGLEIDESRLKKVAAMRRTIELISNYNKDLYIEMAEAELGELVLHDWEF
jgi:nitric oxide synthase oxygenase domain/subunit